MKTISAKPGSVERMWYVVDLAGQTVGRAATQIATILRGKHKPMFTPHVDTGDFIIAINADKVRWTGRKIEEKRYYHHTGYPGGLKEFSIPRMMEEKPGEVIRTAVRRMLPKNSLGRKLLKKFKVYAGPDHPHQAQKPQPLELKK
ncbi:MAG: 50S ribosomal protein L13 [Bradymonadales bacterium]|nr:50S ribosomal protein L13 [Bradymonadales bacterium]